MNGVELRSTDRVTCQLLYGFMRAQMTEERRAPAPKRLQTASKK